MTKIAIQMSGILLPSVALAHPEHASTGDFGLLHFVTDPFHVGLTLFAVGAVLAVRRSRLRRRALDRPQR